MPIFVEKAVIDAIHEYLVLKSVDHVALHGAKPRTNTPKPMKCFRRQEIYPGGHRHSLQGPGLPYIINHDICEETKNYVCQISHTGHSENAGIITTFINKACNESVLTDLKNLLLAAKQKVPPVLKGLHGQDKSRLDIGGQNGCAFCGHLGHCITQTVPNSTPCRPSRSAALTTRITWSITLRTSEPSEVLSHHFISFSRLSNKICVLCTV